MSYRKIGGITVPTVGMKLVHMNGVYRAEVLMIANAKYADPRTVQVVFRGNDGETYSRPLDSFWDNWRGREEKFAIYTTDGCDDVLYMRRCGSHIDWVESKSCATPFSNTDAEARIRLLLDSGARGRYYTIPI